MTVIHLDNGKSFWTPTSTTPPVEPGRDEEEAFKGTIESTKRMHTMLAEGKVTEEDYQSCLEKNSEHIGVSKEYLDNMVKEPDKETNPELL